MTEGKDVNKMCTLQEMRVSEHFALQEEEEEEEVTSYRERER